MGAATKMMKEIADLTPTELAVKERELREQLFNLRMKSGVGQIEKPSQIRRIRRDIARVLTAASAKARTEEQKRPAPEAHSAATKTAAKGKAAKE